MSCKTSHFKPLTSLEWAAKHPISNPLPVQNEPQNIPFQTPVPVYTELQNIPFQTIVPVYTELQNIPFQTPVPVHNELQNIPFQTPVPVPCEWTSFKTTLSDAPPPPPISMRMTLIQDHIFWDLPFVFPCERTSFKKIFPPPPPPPFSYFHVNEPHSRTCFLNPPSPFPSYFCVNEPHSETFSEPFIFPCEWTSFKNIFSETSSSHQWPLDQPSFMTPFVGFFRVACLRRRGVPLQYILTQHDPFNKL